MVADVLIIGGGIAGVSLAYKLSLSGISNILIDSKVLGGRSSTRNQGWLQGGLFYSNKGDDEVARLCASGYKFILQFAKKKVPNALVGGVASYFLFRTKEELTIFKRNAKRNKLRTGFKEVEINEVIRREQLLGGSKSPLKYAVKTNDIPINTELIIGAFADEAIKLGSEIILTKSPLEQIELSRKNEGWAVKTSEGEVFGKLLVVACGATIPEILAKAGVKDAKERFRRTKILVAALDRKISNSMLIVPTVVKRISLPPSIVPFFDNSGIEGTTICLVSDDEDTDNPNDENIDPRKQFLLATSLRFYYPRFLEMISSSMIGANFYPCYKIEISGKRHGLRTHILLDHSQVQNGSIEGVITFYPGKFTMAPIAADECVDILMSKLGQQSTMRVKERTTSELKIARRKCLDKKDHLVYKKGNSAIFERKRD